MTEEQKEQLPEFDPVKDNATPEDFKTKNKVYELLLYIGPELEQFPRAQRKLADDIRATTLQILRLVVTFENKHYKKTTRGDLDNEVDVLRTLYGLPQTRIIHGAGKRVFPYESLCYMFHAYTIGEIDKEMLDRSIASYRGILKHF